MRSILFALSLGLAAATVAYAHTGDGSAPVRPAGTLTCKTLTNASLVFGRTRPAFCTFVSQDGRFAQSYAALLPSRADDAGDAAGSIVWRVRTANGASRPGMLDGTFDLSEPGAILRGRAAGLEPIGDRVEASVTLAASAPLVELGALRAE